MISSNRLGMLALFLWLDCWGGSAHQAKDSLLLVIAFKLQQNTYLKIYLAAGNSSTIIVAHYRFDGSMLLAVIKLLKCISLSMVL